MKKKKLHVIFVPGLGDHRIKGQETLVRTWKLWGVSSELFQTNWADGKAWEPKFKRLLERIDAVKASGKNVSLVGASAGAASVINAYAARPLQIAGVVLIAGKVNYPERIGQEVRNQNPAFITAAYATPNALASLGPNERMRIMSIFSVKDGLLQQDDSRIPNARNRYTFVMGHPFVIASQLLFGAPSFIRFLKNQII